MITSAETLPDLSSPYPLTKEQIEAYQRDGHILLRGVCSPEEIAVYGPIIREAAYRYNTQNLPIEQRDTYGKAFLQIMNLWVRDERVRKYVLARRFARIAAELMGVEGVRIYHDQALFKEAGGGPTPWHQDFYYWPLDTDKTITMWMPLVDADETMGTMTFASGSHTQGFLGHFEISDTSEEYFRNFVAEHGFPLHSAGAMKAGDATFHAGATLHSAPGNKSDRTREVMTIIYFADGVRVMEKPDNKNRWLDLETWLPGVKPGELAVSELNPLVYRKE
ncbi:MAG TPA: phytanoyl-CoA dioxygenase family protein [Chthonomonas sp.]|jgi:ectoine hydroxylase-related dioxygenase (phytanoyl-CoA dioxygenase family)|uniref:phytanoyl-CoA dioxygenase family protein n=1 Tax=Chthonomonas sp. TaxID=2282153 RepID=UPI002B4AFE5F|nr:phytanoyl-CoA dioxygenase family protein [Chthonomonas sp.]HLH80836.1 phytanoyl-CoA dioxygenase family protein [Chthonomonas sp.]